MRERINKHITLLTLGLILQSSILKAQVWDTLCIESHHIDTTNIGTLRAEVNAIAFFQNNEYSCDIMKGYTLPGSWLQPKLAFSPNAHIHLEAGAHLLFFDGANRYPNMAYSDIATWKGNQYQHGIHALPYFRAQADVRHLSIVLGDIYGIQNHQLILPLFNPEQALSADPEMGLQLLLDRPRVHLDLWLNWQSYIFELDTHQEAFTVGINSTIRWSKDKAAPLQWETPLQLLIQHRGGEQDITSMGVQTVSNAAAGFRLTYRPRAARRTLQSLRAEANVLASYQQHGQLWPFQTGFAIHTALRAVMLRHLGLELGYFGAPRQYANLFGSPLFGTLSMKHSGQTYRGVHTPYASVSYAYTFTPHYCLGAQLDLFEACPRGASSALLFGFGVYLRVSPSFVLTRKK